MSFMLGGLVVWALQEPPRCSRGFSTINSEPSCYIRALAL